MLLPVLFAVPFPGLDSYSVRVVGPTKVRIANYGDGNDRLRARRRKEGVYTDVWRHVVMHRVSE